MNKLEIERTKFQPEKINLLFVAESPPQNGTFFYFENSNLYSALFAAFQKVFPSINKSNFLQEFKNKGFYLEDLCLTPVNNIGDFERIQERIKNIPDLAERIKSHNPKIIIILMKEIAPYIDEAINQSGIDLLSKIVTSFPAHSQSNIDKCISDVEQNLKKYVAMKLLQ